LIAKMANYRHKKTLIARYSEDVDYHIEETFSLFVKMDALFWRWNGLYPRRTKTKKPGKFPGFCIFHAFV